MKYLIPICLVVAFLLQCCTKAGSAAETVLNEMLPPDSSGNNIALYNGSFINGPYGSVNGNVSVYRVDGKYILALKNVSISNGPDLHVYLSKQIQPLDFIDIGKLRSTNGNQLYEISRAADFAAYRYALIHCQQFNHLFGSAELK